MPMSLMEILQLIYIAMHCVDRKWEWIDDPAIMEKDVVIFLVCIGFILLVTVVGVVVTIFYFKMIRRQRLIR